MNIQIKKQKTKARLHKKVRSQINNKVTGALRLSAYRSNKEIFLQIIDDASGKTLVSAHSKEIKDSKSKTEDSFVLGKLLAQKAKDKKITKVVFDRGSCRYHGRVKAAAEGARDGGLIF